MTNSLCSQVTQPRLGHALRAALRPPSFKSSPGLQNDRSPMLAHRAPSLLCPGEDLNLHSRSHIHLKDACIPISPPGLGIRAHKMSWPAYYSGPAHFSQLLALMQLPRLSFSPLLKLPPTQLPPRSQLLPQLPLGPPLRLLESLQR